MSRPELVTQQPQCFSAVLNSIVLAKCINAHLWENSPYVSKQLKGIGPTFSTLLASAGITNFTILEESHPRDLERVRKEAIIYPYVILWSIDTNTLIPSPKTPVNRAQNIYLFKYIEIASIVANCGKVVFMWLEKNTYTFIYFILNTGCFVLRTVF